MKKLISFVLAAVLCFGMATTVLAAPSAERPVDSVTGDNTQVPGSVTGVVGAVTNDVLNEKQQAAIADVLVVYTDTAKRREVEKELISNYTNVNVENIVASALVDLEVPAGVTIDPVNGTWVKICGFNVNASAVVLHMDENGNWENIPTLVTGGYLYGKFTSLSPVYYFAVEASTPSYSAGSNTSAEVEYTSGNTPMRWLTSAENGNISISGKQTVIPEGAEFSAKLVTGDAYEAIAAAVAKAKGGVSFVAYDFNLSDANGNALKKFSSHVDVQMPVPAGLNVADGNTVTVYYYNNGKLEKCNTVLADGLVTFGTTHFSTFVYVAETPASAAASSVVSPKTVDNSMNLYVVMLAIVACAGMVYTTRKAR